MSVWKWIFIHFFFPNFTKLSCFQFCFVHRAYNRRLINPPLYAIEMKRYILYFIRDTSWCIICSKLHFNCWTLLKRERLSLFFYSIVACVVGSRFFRFVCYYIYRKMHLGISQRKEGICSVHEAYFLIFVML